MPGAFNYNFQTSKKGSAFQGPTAGLVYTSSTTAPINPTVGDLWFDTNNAILLVYVNDGSSSQWIETGSTNVGAGSIVSSGRLTLESGVPVSTTDQTSKTIVYYTPYNGNTLSLYNGTSWNSYTFSEVSISLGTLTSGKNYDVFAYVSGSTVTLELGAAWTSDTARSDAISLLNGVYVKTSNNTRRYLGTFRTTATTTTEDSSTKRFLWSINNQQQRSMLRNESTASWTYQALAYRYVNNSSSNRVEVVCGLPSFLYLTCNLWYTNATTVQGIRTAIGEDSSTTPATECIIGDGATIPGYYLGASAFLSKTSATGYHFYAWMESTFTTVAVTIYGQDTVYRKTGITGYFIG